jgi:hypothetical protein
LSGRSLRLMIAEKATEMVKAAASDRHGPHSPLLKRVS